MTGPGAHLLVFQAGDRRLALPAEEVGEVLHLPELERPPGTPAAIAGFFNLGGTAVTVLDLRVLFGQETRETAVHTPLILLKGAQPTALLVDDLEGVLPKEETAARLPEGRVYNDLVTEVAWAGDRAVEVLAASRLLTEEERRRVDAFRAEADRRLRLLTPAG